MVDTRFQKIADRFYHLAVRYGTKTFDEQKTYGADGKYDYSHTQTRNICLGSLEILARDGYRHGRLAESISFVCGGGVESRSIGSYDTRSQSITVKKNGKNVLHAIYLNGWHGRSPKRFEHEVPGILEKTISKLKTIKRRAATTSR